MALVYDKLNFEYMSKHIQKNDIVVDVGANIGDYTDFFISKLENTGKIYTIELHPTTSQNLNEKYFNMDNVIVINKAVSNVDGVINYYHGNSSETHNIIGHDVSFNKCEILGEIESIRLDTLLINEEVINIIKIDVEGAELQVLEGLKNIINKVNYILLECHLDEDWDNIKNILFDYKLKCTNTFNNEEITELSNRPYQCFCKK
jgi:FkbM family methyltransferase